MPGRPSLSTLRKYFLSGLGLVSATLLRGAVTIRSTTAGGFTQHPVSLRDEHRRAGIEVLEIIDRAVELGALPQAPRKGTCGWCDFRGVCGPLEEDRARRKGANLGVLEDLEALRGMP